MLLRRFSFAPPILFAAQRQFSHVTKSVSNGIKGSRAARYRANSPLMAEATRREVEAAIKQASAESSASSIVLDLMDDAPNFHQQDQEQQQQHEAERSTSGKTIPPASAWWADACVLRRNRETRFHSNAAVIGGAANIQRIWRQLGVAPRCVFVPDDAPVPEWASTGAVVVVRAPGAKINGELLSADHNDGFAAEFPLPVRLPRDFALQAPSTSAENQGSNMNQDLRLSRVVVAHGLRVPGNVGSLIKSARRAGFDAIVLDRCCDVTSEKVLRAAGEAAFDPKFHIFEFGHKLLGGGERTAATQWAEGVNSALLLKRIAASHRLLPLMLVPQSPFSSVVSHARPTESQHNSTATAYDIFSVAQQFHFANSKHGGAKKNTKMGAMLIVGGEAAGLSGIAADWNRDALHVPVLPVSVRMDNPLVTSINVAQTGSLAMHLFRPKAEAEFAEYFRRGIVPPQHDDDDQEDGDDSHDDDSVPRLDVSRILESLENAAEASERLLK